MSLFGDVATLVGELLSDTDLGLGASITYTSVTPGTYDPATGSATPTTTAETVFAVIEDFRGLELLSGLVQAGDKKVSIPAASLTATPKPTDTITAGGHTYTVEQVSDVQGGSDLILHVLQCRRA